MKFGLFYEHQLPKPWAEDAEHRLLNEALEQLVLADRLGFDHAWHVEHHFLEEYAHCSAPEVFMASAAARGQPPSGKRGGSGSLPKSSSKSSKPKSPKRSSLL